MSESIISMPLHWADYEPGLFRLPGFGGAAWFVRTVVLPSRESGENETSAVLDYDIGLLTPTRFTRYLGRTAEPGLPGRLSAFFLGAASEWHPEASVAAVVDDTLRLRLEVLSSTEQRVGLLLTLATGDEGAEPDGLDFETSRAALAQAARDVRFLDHVEEEPGGLGEPPIDWSTS